MGCSVQTRSAECLCPKGQRALKLVMDVKLMATSGSILRIILLDSDILSERSLMFVQRSRVVQ